MDRFPSLIRFLVALLALCVLSPVVLAVEQHPTRKSAYDDAAAGLAAMATWCQSSYPNLQGYGPAVQKNEKVMHVENGTNPFYRYYFECWRPPNHPTPTMIGSGNSGPPHYYPYADRCIAPAEHNPETGNCEDPNARCLALNSQFSAMGPQPRTWTSRCLANGCQMVMDNPVTTQVQGLGAVHRGTLRITGACAAAPTTPVEDPEDDKKDKECTPAPGGQTFCVKANGEKCYSASAGRQVCWTDGETGTKTDGDVAQKRTPGTDPQTPPTPPENTTLTPGTPTTTTQSGGGKPNITTTVINYTTNTGTDAGDSNDGENTSGGDGGEEDGTGVTGGQDCNTPPACMDNREAVGCAILLQSWKNRCALEGNGFDPAAEAAAVDATLPAAGNSGVPGLGIEDEGSGIYNGIVNGSHGWAPRPQCPINIGVNIRWGFITADNSQLCQVMDALAALVLLAGYVAAGFILMGAQKGI